MNTPNLFEEFPVVTRDDWKNKVIQDLKGADFDKRLTWKTLDGLQLSPFYTIEDRPEGIPSRTKSGWRNYQYVLGETDQALNQDAHILIDRGVDALIFDLSSNTSADIACMLKGIDLNSIAVAFAYPSKPQQILKAFLEVAPKEVEGFMLVDFTQEWADYALEECSGFPAFKPLCFVSTPWVDNGCNRVQEIAYLSSLWVDAIDICTESGHHIDRILSSTYFITGIGGDYFHEIAKYRALRKHLGEVLAAYGASIDASEIPVMGMSSYWNKSTLDSNVNILRNTTEAMSAVLGGCDAICIHAHDALFRAPDAFSRRVALNISHLLKEESYLDKVADPAAGSYYLDSLTVQLAERAWQLFSEIEINGGFSSCQVQGKIDDEVAKIAVMQQKDLSTRKMVLVGANRYPNNIEHIASTTLAQGLKLPHAAVQFEEVRFRTERYVENGNPRPTVGLALFGDLAMRKARATFSADFFGLAGFAMHEQVCSTEADFSDVLDAHDITVLCSADADYIEQAVAIVTSLKRHNPSKKVILAGFPQDVVEQLQQAGLDGFIHMKTNVIEALSALQEQLF